MRRNLDMMRDLMLEIENRNHGDRLVTLYNCTPDELRDQRAALLLDVDERELASANPLKYHQALLLHEAGFIAENATFASRRGPFTQELNIERLTNEGHDFLDSIRDDGILQTVKEKLRVVGGTASMEMIKVLAQDSVKDLLGMT